MRCLAVELQINVCEYLARNDLASVARTSKHFLAVAQPILYRDVEVHDIPVGSVHSPDYTNPSRLRSFHNTLLSHERDLGPLVKRLYIRSLFVLVPWKELIPIFLAMRNLLVLKIEMIHQLINSNHNAFSKHILPAVAHTLRELYTVGINAFPRFVRFIDTHPNIIVWDDAGRDWALKQAQDVRMALESPGLARLRRFTVTLVYRNLGFLFEVLKSMTGLIHLSILLPHVALDHANSSNLQGAFAGCGANLVELSLLSEYREPPDRLGWIILNILPQTPSLHRLRIEWRGRVTIVPCPLEVPAGHQDSTVLPALETIIWSVLPASDIMMICVEPNRTFSDAGSKNIETLFHVFPSLRKVEYTEWTIAACFRLLGNGKIEQEPMEGTSL